MTVTSTKLGGICMTTIEPRWMALGIHAKSMTINQLSELIGFKSNSVLYMFKHGKIKKPSFELMEKIADALRVSMDDFRKSGDYK